MTLVSPVRYASNDPLPPLCRDPYQSSADVSLGKFLILNNNWLTKYDSVKLAEFIEDDEVHAGQMIGRAGSS
jgi:hypothetical protein